MLEQIRRFPCPSCRQIITDDLAKCRYCGAPVDKAIAQAAADTQDRVNQAYSDASFLRTAAAGMWVLLLLSLVPFIPLVGYGFIFTFFAVIVLFVRWQVRFANINTPDPDYAKAKRNKNVALALWVAAIPVGFIFGPLLSILIRRLVS
ncbi:MAG: hypothetical protein M3268_01285 [Acidobacteriota bacterium]|nr:hypothetical protein [Acidobacteriota bacterium]